MKSFSVFSRFPRMLEKSFGAADEPFLNSYRIKGTKWIIFSDKIFWCEQNRLKLNPVLGRANEVRTFGGPNDGRISLPSNETFCAR